MKRIFALLPFFIIIQFTGCVHSTSDEITIRQLKCEYMQQAIVATASPRFSWELVSDEEGQEQTAWQVIVSEDKNKIDEGVGTNWDSKKVPGDITFNCLYKGNKLQSFTKYFWKVRIWDINNRKSRWSETADFITGAMDGGDWKASWIGDYPEPPLDYPLLYKHIGYLSAYSDDVNEEKWVQVDLGKSTAFNRIKLYPAHNNIRHIIDYYFPLAYRIEVSEDGASWDLCLERKTGPAPGGAAVDHSFDQVRGQFIRFVATQLKKYDHRIYDYEDRGDLDRLFAFSLAELEVMNNDVVLSGGCKVTCKDALVKVDREDGYDAEMLTDGLTNTPEYPKRRPIPPSPLLRKAFTLKEKPVEAFAYVSALGLYEISFNSRHPDHRVLAPEWTDYHKRVQYQAYDVTDLLQTGDNAIGAQLADGWYTGMLGPTRWSPYFPKRGAYGLDRRLFLQLELRYQNGEKETIVSDNTWKIHRDGPIRMADLFLGETYDANKEIENWKTATYDDSSWEQVTTDPGIQVKLVPQTNQPISIVETLEAVNVIETENGAFLFDVGENIAGWCNISIEGRPRDTIVMRHGEILNEDGMLYTENLGAAIQTDSVVLGPTGNLVYESQFTYHGFRYVEVTGLRKTPDKSILKAKVVASDQPRSGFFECSNPMLNQLYKNINRSHVSNMHGVPTDCPQRDERCGWMGDAFIFAQTSMYNRDMAAFYNKWMIDILDAQSDRGTFPDIAPHPFGYEKHFTNAPGWADAAIKLPYLVYQNYGDKKILENNFGAFVRYIENIRKSNPDLIWKSGLGLNYGDWLNGNTLNAKGFPRTGAQIPSEVFSTIMFYNSTNILSKMAKVIGKEQAYTYYQDLALNIKSAFNEAFVDEEGKIQGDAQACYAMALYYDIYPEHLEQILEQRMIEKFIPYDGRMNTGFHSTICLMQELAKRGYTDKAYELLESKEFPSWGYSIEQGATSIWERWDGYVKGRGFQGAGMNSFNHYAFGSVGEWMYEHILGIKQEEASVGFRKFILKPIPGGTLTWAKGSCHTISGNIEVGWKMDGNRFEYDFSVPANTSATVYVPCLDVEDVLIEGQKVTDVFDGERINYQNGYVSFEVGPGTYTTSSTLKSRD